MYKPKFTKELLDQLVEYLTYHEEDIAIGIDDYGDLTGVFEFLFKRKPLYEQLK